MLINMTSLTFIFVVLMTGQVFSSSCPEGYFLKELGKCVNCPDHCVSCVSDLHCLACEDGYWGNTCERRCSKCQPGTSCEKTNGYCFEKCRDGFSGILCDAFCNQKCFSCDRMNAGQCVKCTHGLYGESCDKQCSRFCYNKTCNDNGHCMSFCENGNWGPSCEHKCSEQCKGFSCNIQNGSCIWGYDVKKNKTVQEKTDTNGNDESGAQENNRKVLIITLSVVCLVIGAITLGACIGRKKYIEYRHGKFTRQRAADKLTEQLEQSPLTHVSPPAHKIELLAPHITIGPSIFKGSGYVTDFTGKTAYIICKEPTKEDAAALLKMIWDEECGVIVLLSQTQETSCLDTRTKAMNKLSVSVTNIKELFFDGYIHRTLYMETMHFLKWPPDEFPEDEVALIEFCQKVQELRTDLKGPLLVQCSDGVRCSRLYIALDMILKELKRQDVSIMQCLDLLRAEGLISSKRHYNFLVRTIAKINKPINKPTFKRTESATDSGFAYADV